jgi:hypothetical protein
MRARGGVGAQLMGRVGGEALLRVLCTVQTFHSPSTVSARFRSSSRGPRRASIPPCEPASGPAESSAHRSDPAIDHCCSPLLTPVRPSFESDTDRSARFWPPCPDSWSAFSSHTAGYPDADEAHMPLAASRRRRESHGYTRRRAMAGRAGAPRPDLAPRHQRGACACRHRLVGRRVVPGVPRLHERRAGATNNFGTYPEASESRERVSRRSAAQTSFARKGGSASATECDFPCLAMPTQPWLQRSRARRELGARYRVKPLASAIADLA